MGYPEAEIDATINKQIDVAVVGEQSMFRQTLAAANKSAQQLSNVTDNAFLQMVQLWQANAAQVLMDNKLAENILAQRSAMNQPQQAPSVVVPAVLKTE